MIQHIDVEQKKEKYQDDLAGKTLRAAKSPEMQGGKHAGLICVHHENVDIDGSARETQALVRQKTVSLCMVVKDETQYLAKCLSSAEEIVDEIIVVDTGSTDDTKEIAKKFDARVYDFEWDNDYSKARNFSMSHATGDWIFVLDADEAISAIDYEVFKNAVCSVTPNPVAYSFLTRNYTFLVNTVGWTSNDGKYTEEAGTGWYPSVKVRLFPNENRFRFQYPVHEVVDPSLKAAGVEIRKCNIPIHHYGHLRGQKNRNKGENYYQMGISKLSHMEDDFSAVRELAVQAGNLEKWDQAIVLWQKVIAINPNFAEAYINMGTAYWHLGKYSTAMGCAQKALSLAPHMKEGQFNCAISNLLLGNVTQAIHALENLIAESPDYPAAQFMLGACYCCDERKDKALPFFRRLAATSVGPGLSFAFYDLGKRLISAQKTNYAISLLKVAIETNNVNKDILDLLETYSQKAMQV